MTTALAQTPELPFPVRLKSALSKRGVALSSLRPGAFICRDIYGHTIVASVVQNSKTLCRIELRYPTGSTAVIPWWTPTLGLYVYMGMGRKRRWWPMLPAWARKWVCEYGRPE